VIPIVGLGMPRVPSSVFPSQAMTQDPTLAAIMAQQNRMLPWIMHQNYLLHCSGQGIPTMKEKQDPPPSHSSSPGSDNGVRRRLNLDTSLPKDDHEETSSEGSDICNDFAQPI